MSGKAKKVDFLLSIITLVHTIVESYSRCSRMLSGKDNAL